MTWTPETLVQLTLVTIYRMEHLKLNEHLPKLNHMIGLLKDEDEIKRITRLELLYIIAYLDKINNYRTRSELSLYN